MTKKIISLVVIFSVLSFTVAMAVTAPDYTKFDFNQSDIFGLYYGSTRAMSFGGAYYVNGDDIGALLFNPAQILTMPKGNLGISGIVANGPLEAVNKRATVTPRGASAPETIDTFTLVATDSAVFYPTFGGVKLGSLALMYSKPYFIPIYRRFTKAASITAPDEWQESYNQFALYDDFSNFNVYSAVLGMGNRILAGGVRATYFSGPVVRYVRGHESDSDNYWYRKEKVDYNGYTVDAGAILNLFLAKAGIVYKNLASNIEYTKTGAWADSYSGGYYATDEATSGTLSNRPYLVGSLGADIGILKAEISAYNLDPQALQEGVLSASGIALGAQANLSLFQVRMGARMPFGRFMGFVNDPSQLNFILFDPNVHLSFGLGLALGPLQADVAFGKNILMKAMETGDIGNYWSLNTGFNLLF